MKYSYVCDCCGPMVRNAPVEHRDSQACDCGLPLARQFDVPEIRIPIHMRADNDHEPVLPRTASERATAERECFAPAKSGRWS